MTEEQEILSQIKLEIFKKIDPEVELYYGVPVEVYNGIDEYLNRLPDLKDKIALAQWANNYKKVDELILKLKITESEMNKYLKLKQKNAEINQTLNFKILSEKYDFLSDTLDMIVTDVNTQELIISLSDEKLEVFKLLYENLKKLTDYTIPYMIEILRKLGTLTPFTHWMNSCSKYPELTKEIEEVLKSRENIDESLIETLLFIYTSPSQWLVESLEDVKNIMSSTSKDSIQLQNMIDNERTKEVKNIDKIKEALLFKTYGISLNTAKKILGRYDITGLEVTEENKDLFEMYEAIARIVCETDSNLLISIYDEFTKSLNTKLDFMRITVFENSLRKEFAKALNNCVFKTDNKSFKLVDGVKVIDAGEDFKMIVTAVGAYQDRFKDMENYSTYWNSASIRSHGNCCSLIANNNLSMAEAKNIILGFSTMSDNMLLLCGDKDLNSTPDSKELNTTIKLNQNFYSASKLINITRADYNELVYERRDLSSNPKFYKKNPDYIVFIEEYENIDEYIERYKNQPQKLGLVLKQKQEQERMWKETLKAAQNFNVPIVKINREKCAKKSVNMINDLLLQFKSSKNPNLIYEIITQFENNRVGNNKNHIAIRERYFSMDFMNLILGEIENIIINESNLELKDILLKKYREAISNEKKLVKAASLYRKMGQTSGINFDLVLSRIEGLQSDKVSDIGMGVKR